MRREIAAEYDGESKLPDTEEEVLQNIQKRKRRITKDNPNKSIKFTLSS